MTQGQDLRSCSRISLGFVGHDVPEGYVFICQLLGQKKGRPHVLAQATVCIPIGDYPVQVRRVEADNIVSQDWVLLAPEAVKSLYTHARVEIANKLTQKGGIDNREVFARLQRGELQLPEGEIQVGVTKDLFQGWIHACNGGQTKKTEHMRVSIS